MTNEKQNQTIDLKPYQPYGIPMLKLFGGLVVLSLVATALYEYFI